VSRFSEAISEGDGISVIPVLEGDVEALAAIAEEAGAEGIAVRGPDVGRVRARTTLPILARDGEPETVAGAGADAVVLSFEDVSDDNRLRALWELELPIEYAVDVREEDQLEDVLERIDPEIVPSPSARSTPTRRTSS
jgi:hypothetical protein